MAHYLLLENDDIKIWQVDTPAGETFWHPYHELDYVLFHTSEMFGTVYHVNEDSVDSAAELKPSAGLCLDRPLCVSRERLTTENPIALRPHMSVETLDGLVVDLPLPLNTFEQILSERAFPQNRFNGNPQVLVELGHGE